MALIPLLPPPVPDELRPIPLLGGEQGGGEGLGKARVVETDAGIRALLEHGRTVAFGRLKADLTESVQDRSWFGALVGIPAK